MKSVKYLWVLLLVMATQAARAVQTISLNDALHKKIVKVDIRGLGSIDGVNSSSHYGKCMGMKITNLTGYALKINLETGRFLNADSTSVQNMLVTQNSITELQPHQSRNVKLYAMCSEKYDHAPGPDKTFKPGPMSTGNLFHLAKIIEEKKYQNNMAQYAVWALTDHIDIASVSGDDPLQQKLLREFLSTATTKPLPPEEPKKNRNSMATRETREIYTISCWFEYEVAKANTVSVILYNSNGEIVKELMPATQTKSGSYSKTCTLSTAEFPIGEYEIKLQIGRNNILSRKIYLGPRENAPQEE